MLQETYSDESPSHSNDLPALGFEQKTLVTDGSRANDLVEMKSTSELGS